MYGVICHEWIRGSSSRASRPYPWAARLLGLDDHWGFQREFIRGVKDYSHTRHTQSRGVFIYFALPPGFYEVYYPTSWTHEHRYYVWVYGEGEVTEVTKEHIIECLKNAVSE